MKRYILILAAAALAFAACSSKQENAYTPREIKFTTTIGHFATRATDTGFETGDKVGVFVGDFLENVPLAWNGNELQAASTLYWPETVAGNALVSVIAYYPYSETTSLGLWKSTVNADQSTHALYTASDLMISTNIVAPDDGPVALNFTHALSRILLDIKSDYAIKSVYVWNVYGHFGLYNMLGVQGIDGRGTIKAGKVSLADGSTAWACIVPPQYAAMALVVIAEDGEEYAYLLDEEADIDLEGGMSYKATLVIDGDTVAMDPKWDESEWTADNDVQFKDTTGEIIVEPEE